MKKTVVAAIAVSLSVCAVGPAFALSSGSGSKVFFRREANRQERATQQPQVDQAPAEEAAAPKMHKKRKHKD